MALSLRSKGDADMLIPSEHIEEFAAALRAAGARVVFTNGCFDILHAGHVCYLAAARARGDVLILGLNSDDSVRRLKGEADTAEALIAKVRPAVYAKGGDYTRETLPEARVVEAYGGEVAFIPLVAGKSTTGIIAKAGRRK